MEEDNFRLKVYTILKELGLLTKEMEEKILFSNPLAVDGPYKVISEDLPSEVSLPIN